MVRVRPPWTVKQRKTAIGIVLAILIILGIQYWLDPVDVNDPPPIHGTRFDDLQDRIDPNTADESALSTLPSLGEKRAKDIVTFRENFVRSHRGDIAFNQPADLQRVKGIGPGITANLEPYLIFHRKTTTTRASPTR